MSNQEKCKAPELEFLEMIRSLSTTLPEFLLDYQRRENTRETEEYRDWLTQWNGRVLNEGEQVPPMVFTDVALAIMFHHIAMETFAALEAHFAKNPNPHGDTDDGGWDEALDMIKSGPVHNFWLRFVRARESQRRMRANEILDSLTAEDRESLMQVGVKFPTPKKNLVHRPIRSLERNQ